MGSYPRPLSKVAAQVFPQQLPHTDRFCACWRGGGFRDDFKGFFEQTQDKFYRVPGFLATSLNKSIAMKFIGFAKKADPRVLWCILVRATSMVTTDMSVFCSWTSTLSNIVFFVA